MEGTVRVHVRHQAGSALASSLFSTGSSCCSRRSMTPSMNHSAMCSPGCCWAIIHTLRRPSAPEPCAAVECRGLRRSYQWPAVRCRLWSALAQSASHDGHGCRVRSRRTKRGSGWFQGRNAGSRLQNGRHAEPVDVVIGRYGLIAIPGLVIRRLTGIVQAEPMLLADMQTAGLEVEPLEVVAAGSGLIASRGLSGSLMSTTSMLPLSK